MTVLPIHVLGSSVLRLETELVTTVTDELRQLIDDMFETMYAARGIGLAAPQVGRTERITVIDVDRERILLLWRGCIPLRDGPHDVAASELREVTEGVTRNGQKAA